MDSAANNLDYRLRRPGGAAAAAASVGGQRVDGCAETVNLDEYLEEDAYGPPSDYDDYRNQYGNGSVWAAAKPTVVAQACLPPVDAIQVEQKHLIASHFGHLDPLAHSIAEHHRAIDLLFKTADLGYSGAPPALETNCSPSSDSYFFPGVPPPPSDLGVGAPPHTSTTTTTTSTYPDPSVSSFFPAAVATPLCDADEEGNNHNNNPSGAVAATMSVVYEPRPFMDGNYPVMDDGHDHHHTVSADDVGRYDEPDVSSLAAAAAATYSAGAALLGSDEPRLDLAEPTVAPPLAIKEDSPTASAQSRTKAIPKPERDIQKNSHGVYECTFPHCQDEVKEFSRRCEWNKHMDKHERPYRCTAEGCEKLPGFTYGGGLLRHEREVHGKHGGPKNPLHCPHPNCKRHSGKGFSRQENLNEHLRRVHTGEGAAQVATGEDTDDGASESATGGGGGGGVGGGGIGTGTGTGGVGKRKRDDEGDEMDLREEIKRVRAENAELRRQVDAQNLQTVAMMRQINQLQQALGPEIQEALKAAVTSPTTSALAAV